MHSQFFLLQWQRRSSVVRRVLRRRGSCVCGAVEGAQQRWATLPLTNNLFMLFLQLNWQSTIKIITINIMIKDYGLNTSLMLSLCGTCCFMSCLQFHSQRFNHSIGIIQLNWKKNDLNSCFLKKQNNYFTSWQDFCFASFIFFNSNWF